MDKFKLKFTLLLFNGLMAIKRVLVFLFSRLSRGLLEPLGRNLAHYLIFPIYKFISRKEMPPWRELLIKALYVAAGIIILTLAFTETKGIATAKSLSGRDSLLYQYLGPGDEGDMIEEEAMVVAKSNPNVSNVPSGIRAGAPGGSLALGPTNDIANFSADGVLAMPALMPGVQFGNRHEIIKYAVQSGDTLGSIAQRFSISTQSITSANNITERTLLRPGDTLAILPVDGVSHKIKKGDTVQKIAKLYSADTAEILEFNRLSDQGLPVGETIVIPGGRLPQSLPIARNTGSRASAYSSSRQASLRYTAGGMLWPTAGRHISQYFSWRHTGIDIALPIGNPIYAAEDGVVEKAGWNSGGYGNMVLIDHDDGTKTRYGHASKLFVKPGERVNKGDVIALIGSTGRSTGPHLHFEVLSGGTRVNPFLYVK